MWRRCSATTAHRALPVCRWPALGIPWATARSNAASAVCSRCGGAYIGCCRPAGQVVCECCSFAGCFFFVYGGAAWQPQHTEPCQCVSGQPWARNGPLQGQMQPLKCAAGAVEPALGAAARLGRCFVGGAVLLNAGVFKLWRRRSSETTAHRAMPMCEWPALRMPWAFLGPSAASEVCSR